MFNTLLYPSDIKSTAERLPVKHAPPGKTRNAIAVSAQVSQIQWFTNYVPPRTPPCGNPLNRRAHGPKKWAFFAAWNAANEHGLQATRGTLGNAASAALPRGRPYPTTWVVMAGKLRISPSGSLRMSP